MDTLLTDTNGKIWIVAVKTDGTLTLIPFVAPKNVLLTDSVGKVWALSISSTGRLQTVKQ